ncbi:phosphatase 2C-like domain-containing protein [Mycena haematopus]|nr:phosphatase 2C-like domain-containing protein [Mycena haematopus]
MKRQNVYGATYTVLPEPEVSAELARCARAQSTGVTDIISLQPCPSPSERSQDRFLVADWLIADHIWRFHAVFDGHAGHETVDHLVDRLPVVVHDALVAGIAAGPLDVPELLRKAIADVDERIGQDVLDLFPSGLDGLSDDEISTIINDNGVNSAKVLRCMRGSTVLVALHAGDDVWVASLGDCQCVLGAKTALGWQATVLSSNHNGTEPAETARIRNEHPGEPECMLRTARPGFQISSKITDFLGRNITPPYLSAQSDVQHVHIPSLGASEAFLVLASDGLIDLSGDTYGTDHREPSVAGKKWVEILTREDRTGNAALYLLRDAMGWTADAVSSLLTVESEEGSRWMDDTTIVFTKLV